MLEIFRKMHLLCSRAAIPCRRQFLRKSARNRSSSFFLEKKKQASKPSAKTQLGPQPRLQASAVLSKIAKCRAREIERARERREINIRLRWPCCCAQREETNFPKGTKIQPPQHLPPTATATAKSRAACSKPLRECFAGSERPRRCQCTLERL